jgi:hypothetical protein
VCSDGLCELDCAAAGATCPPGMNCRDVDGSALSELYRCIFIGT